MRRRFFVFLAAIFFTALSFNQAARAEGLQADESLTPNKEVGFILEDKAQKAFTINLKKDDYAEISWLEAGNRFPSAVLTSPSGVEIFDNGAFDSSIPFIAHEDGNYKLVFKQDGDSEDKSAMNLKVSYLNTFKLAAAAKLMRQRKLNGYDVKVYNSSTDDDYATYLLIQKNGKLKEILKGGSLVGGGFQFADDPKLWDYPEGKKSATLFRTTLDKTGDGTPDVAVQFYTGGAHCCTQMYFFELGADDVRMSEMIQGADSDIIATGKKPNGGLILRTGDSNFAYWLTSFAGSPIPTVILSYKDGEFRPDAQLMKKPAPAAASLKLKAAKAKKELGLAPYTGPDEFNVINPFWGEMLDMLYAGNETAAWKYFDMVWDARKPGKEKFKDDFLSQLNKSSYWQKLQEDRNK